jgi:hypothetical protein
MLSEYAGGKLTSSCSLLLARTKQKKIILNPHLWQGLGETVECGLHDELDEADLRACVRARVRAIGGLVGIKAGEQSEWQSGRMLSVVGQRRGFTTNLMKPIRKETRTHADTRVCVRACLRACGRARAHTLTRSESLMKRICVCVWTQSPVSPLSLL